MLFLREYQKSKIDIKIFDSRFEFLDKFHFNFGKKISKCISKY